MPSSPQRTETILVVDDNQEILKMVVSVLKNARFHVLHTHSAAEALTISELQGDGGIDLLLSDVEMPEMSGPDLGEALKKTRPDMHVMFMSGGEKGNLLVLNYGWAYIQKPFIPVKLVAMVSEVLHSPNRSQPGGQEFDARKDSPKTSKN